MNNKSKILSIITLLMFFALLFSTTYAYFTAQGGNPSSANLRLTTYTTDVFTFAIGDAISFNVDQDNFASGQGNILSNTFASAKLTANNKNNLASDSYYLYLSITNNTFSYSISQRYPEVIMTIRDNNGNEVTNLTTLNHVVVTDATGMKVSGYDITDKNGLISIFENRVITTTSSIEEKWNITITFVNYNVSQNANAGKSLSAKVIVQKNKIPNVLSDVCNNGDNLLLCITKLSSKSISSATNIYYHDGTLENGISDNSYRYAGTSDSVNNYICLGGDVNVCSDDNLFRIIGVIDNHIKVIKKNPIGDMLWDEVGFNTWSVSTLNTYLNGEYLSKLSDFSEKIISATWKVGGNTKFNLSYVTPQKAYQNEIINPVATNSKDDKLEYNAKIGLIYVSDFYYAAHPIGWTLTGNNYDKVKMYNWMSGTWEWTISRYANYQNYVSCILNNGMIYIHNANKNHFVRPVFYLANDLDYKGGIGSFDDPIRIS